MSEPDASHPCLSCGACCASYRVSFHWAEAPDSLDEALLHRLGPRQLCMRGTEHDAPRCIALQGEIGRAVSCKVYVHRPPPCDELKPGQPQCQRARARHGLPALEIRP